ncbi:hypothetical protein [Arthrobacter sp. SLBN-83]|uniref:hypothetical protein n=1 Tax=Arthrobacter sp. SLBN-83 TaxID=2768449 RepID=UPI001151C01C|nr:hypothetical protein [Arthrobacter sp. SLBN-83]
MSEVLKDEVGQEEKGGISRRRVAAGVAWSLPVIATAIAAPSAAASGPTPTPTATPATGSFTSGTQNMTSTVSTAHDRTGMVVPALLSLKNLSGVTGQVRVVLTITPPSSAAPAISFSTVSVGTSTLAITRPQSNAAQFSATLPAGATTLDFAFSGYSYTGKKQDSGTYTVTTVITYIQNGISTQMPSAPSTTIVLPKAG